LSERRKQRGESKSLFTLKATQFEILLVTHPCILFPTTPLHSPPVNLTAAAAAAAAAASDRG